MSESQEAEAPPASPQAQPQRARFWLLVSGILFLIWIGVLGFLAATTAEPVVLSRPQLLVSTLDVIADIEEENGAPKTAVRVEEVHWPAAAAKRKGQPLEVAQLNEAEGWRGPGKYVLPLVERDGIFLVAPLPRSPGFAGTVGKLHPPRIYPLTADTRRQLESIRKPE